MTLFVQGGLGLTPFRAGLTMLPLVFAFVAGSRQGAIGVARRGIPALVRGAIVMWLGTAACLVLIAVPGAPSAVLLAPALALFGYGQGVVIAPLFGVVLASVRHAHAGAGGGVLATTQQIANGLGVALLGAVYFAVKAGYSDRMAAVTAIAMVGVIVLGAAGMLRYMQGVAARVALDSPDKV